MKKNSFSQYLFEFALMVLVVKNILDSSTLVNRPEWVDTLLILIFFGTILWKLALQTYTMPRILIYIGFGLLCAYTCIRGNYFYVIFSYLSIIAIQDIDLKEVVRKTSLIKLLFVLIHVVVYFSIMIISPEKISYVYRNGVQRMDFMLGHPNTFSMYVLWSTLEYVYSRYAKLKIPHLMIAWAVNAVGYYFTNSNTSILVSTFVFTCLILDKLEKKKVLEYVNRISKYCFLVCSIVFPLILVTYTRVPPKVLMFYGLLDKFFNGRLMYGAYAYDVFGFTLFGRYIFFAEKTFWGGHWFDEIIFDNSYIWMFILYGYFYLLLISAAFIWLSDKTTVLEKVIIVGYSIYGIMEAYVISASICFPLLFLGKYLYLEIEERRQKFKPVRLKRRKISEREEIVSWE